MAKTKRRSNRLALSRALGVVFFLVILGSQPALIKGIWREILQTVGLLFVVVGVLGRLWSTLYIGGQKDRTLVTDGPYSICRNPLYFFSLIGALGVVMATAMFSLIFLLLAFFAIYYPWIIGNEEALQRELHGAAFEAYRQRTPAFFPRFSLYQEATNCVFDSRLLRKALRDCSGFFVAFAAIHFISFIQSAQLTRAILSLP